MYPMPEFQERDPQAVREFIRKHPLAMIVANGDGGPVATHVPLLLGDGEPLTLRGHLMRKTPYWHGFKASSDVLVAFTGPDAPVLESWNTSLPFGGTWNYMAVHVRGTLRFLPESDLLEILRELKNLYEVDPTRQFDNLPSDYVPALIKAIEGFEIVVSDVQAVFKLSQNRTREDFESTVDHLRDRGGEHALVADEMVARRSRFFPESP
ncbi:MAG TPA: FMN-binding negative transcriptional regulator [Fimbriimonadaceae bacterium]|nr:FMN-binding negative transcriptional regulator [Fimbriimonadaceae bacterium]